MVSGVVKTMNERPLNKVFFIALAMLSLSLLITAAAASIIQVPNSQVNTIGGTTDITLMLDEAPAGLVGYSISISASDSSVANVTDVKFPTWAATLHDNSSFPSSSCTISAADVNDQIKPGATLIPLATLTLQGRKAGSTPVVVTVNKMWDDNEVRMNPSVQSSTFTVSIPPRNGNISVTSSPAGASIKLNGTDTGKITPYTLTDVSEGSNTVEVSLAGYKTASKPVTVVAGSTVDVDFQLEAIVNTGSIAVTSTPPGAEIKLDGTDTGKITPYTLTDVSVGSHTVEVSLAGYKTASKTVTVVAGSTVDVDFQLEVKVNTGSIAVTSTPPGAEIKLDGTAMSLTTPNTFTGIGEGPHIVEVSLAGYKTASKTVNVLAGTTVDVDFPLEPDQPLSAPEFPSLALPVGMTIGFIGVVYHIRARKE
jgi:hypothetical protein